MIPTIEEYTFDRENLGLTWNSKWIQEFESPWSIFEKIRTINYATKLELLKLFGNEVIKNRKGFRGKTVNNLYLLQPYSDKYFKSYLGFSMKLYNQNMIDTLSSPLFLNKNKDEVNSYNRDYWSVNLSFCPSCLKEGYHSLFHQFNFFDRCPFHEIELMNECPNCAAIIPYEITENSFIDPYTCMCGYSFCQKHNIADFFNPTFKVTKEKIKDSLVKQWINLDNEQSVQLQNTALLNPQKNLSRNFILCILGIENDSENSRNSNKIIRSSPFINSIYKLNENRIKMKNSIPKINPINNLLYFNQIIGDSINPYKYVLNKLLNTKRKTIQAISKNLRKTILKKHKSCIQRLVRITGSKDTDELVCPYAHAYVRWKQFLYNMDHYYEVDNKPYYHKKIYFYDLSLGPNPDFDLFYKCIEICITKQPIHDVHKTTSMKWIIQHLVGHICLQAFYNYLKKISKDESINDFDVFNIEDDIAIMCSTVFKKPLTFIQPNAIEKEFITQLNCPYSTQKSKRKKENSYSNLPLKVAIDKKELQNP